jgi:uncharacterized protein (DUF433 family)
MLRTFVGIRVPIKTLVDYLESSGSINEFLDHFFSVSREQAIAIFKLVHFISTVTGFKSHF